MSAAHTLRIYGCEARAQITAVSRQPQFLIPTLLLPILFFGFIGLGVAKGQEIALRQILGAYAIFASVAPGLFGFGAGLASEREAGLVELKRVAPMPIGAYLSARVASALSVVTLALGGVFALAVYGGVHLEASRWAALFALGLGATLPFCLIGLNIGLRLGAQGAVAVANLIFFAFCLFGGLWVPLEQMPDWIAAMAWALPTFHFSQLARMITGAAPIAHVGAHLAVIAAITAAAAAGAWQAWRRQVA